MLGGWTLADFNGVKLPQKVASGFVAVTGEMVGAEYQPILFLGTQVVNGTNYCVLAVQKLVTPKTEGRIVKVIINEATDGSFSLVSISGVAL